MEAVYDKTGILAEKLARQSVCDAVQSFKRCANPLPAPS